MVLVDQVHKSFGPVHAVRGVSFELKPGQVAGLLGPNGAGKTTTIRMIAGFLLPDSGRVSIAGADTVSQPHAARVRLGYLPESTPLYEEMKVREYLGYRARLFGIPGLARPRAIAHALERCWLKDVASRRIGALSKGYKQRVGLAAALLHNPAVLVLDEPTNGLDPTQIRETRQLVRELATDRTMLICSHILPEVERLCDRVIIIAAGKVRADGNPAQLARDGVDGAVYQLQVRGMRPGDDERLGHMWRSIPYVVGALRTDKDRPGDLAEWTSWSVSGKHGAPDLREAIATAAVQNGVLIRELRSETNTLERVFLRLIDEIDDDADEGRDAA